MKRLDEMLRDEVSSHILPFLWMKGEEIPVIREELDRIEACGIREICLESRPYPDFCGPKWWETMDSLVPELHRRGMRVWILDDKKFPTGYANGGFERQPDKAKRYLAERHMDIMGPCAGGAVVIDKFYGDGRLLAVLAVPKPDTDTLDISGEGVIDLTDRVRDGFVFFDLPEGAYRLFILFETRTGGGRDNYMNLIDTSSVRVLLDEVYEKHYAHYAPYFGTTIAGFFSDEPELGNVKGYPFDQTLGKRDVRLPWSAELEALLRADWGEAFAHRLPALWYGMGEGTAAVRSGYMERLTGLVHTCFTGQVGAWCAAHGVEYIGHIIEDDNAHARLGCSIGHYFREMQGQHMAGVDVVHHQIVPGFTGRIHQWIAGDADGEFFHFALAKLAASAAHIDPRKQDRALCEVFGNYGWAEGVSLMRWLTCHMLVRGVNVFTPHAFSMTFPDRDCPPHFYARGNNPQYPAFARLMRFMQRGAHLLTGGQPLADAAVLYHAEAEWSGAPYMLCQRPVRALAERQLDADIVPCDAVLSARVEDGGLVMGHMRYPCLVLPYAACIKPALAAFIADAAAAGVRVLAVDALPAMDMGQQLLDADLAARLAAAVTVVPLAELAQAVSSCVPARFTASSPDAGLRAMAVQHADGLACMFFNENVTRRVCTDVAIRGGYTAASLVDPWNNTAETIAFDGTLAVTLEPGEALFCVLTDDPADRPARRVCGEQQLDLGWRVSRADEWHYDAFEPVMTLCPGDRLPNMNGLEGAPTFTGWYRYESEFEADKQPDSAYRLSLPRGGDTAQVFVNGIDCGYLANFPGSVDVTAALRSGVNTLRIEFSTTLVWKLRDGASTHLQLSATGLGAAPVLRRMQ